MRWSEATIHIALQLMCNGAGTKIFDRINNMDIIKLPNNKTMNLKRYKFQHTQGVTPKFIKQMHGSLMDWRKTYNNKGDPFLILKYDELYVRGGIVFNPNSMQILGLTSDFESGNFITPLYEIINDIANNKNVDKLILKHNSAKVILQTIIADLGSKWSYVGPYWSSSQTMNLSQMYKFLIEGLLLGMIGYDMEIFAMLSDMSSPNLSLIQMLSGGKNCQQLSDKEILLDIPFYDRKVLFMFDAQHSLKSLRNALFDSREIKRNVQTQTFPLQFGKYPISVDHLRTLYEQDTTTYLSNRTLSEASLYLNAWSKQRVSLALNIFNENVYSAMDGIDEYKGTMEYIQNTMKLLVGTFVAPNSKGTGSFDNIITPKNGMIDQLDDAFKYFHKLQTNENCKGLHVKKYLMISSIRYGFEYICKEFCNHYKDPNNNDRLLEGVFLRPSRLSTNEVEKLFSKIRGMGCAKITDIPKANAMFRTQQDLSLQVKKSKQKTSVLGKRQFGGGYKNASLNNKRKRRKTK